MSQVTWGLKIAEEGDFPYVERFTKEFLNVGELPFIYDRNVTLASYRFIIANPMEATIILGLRNKEPVGFLVGAVVHSLYSKDRLASEVAWYIEPKYRGRIGMKMFKAYEYWAKEIAGCSVIQMSKLESSGELEKLYSKLGYQKKEESFFKNIKGE